MPNRTRLVFLSHTHADQAFAARLSSQLRKHGVSVWAPSDAIRLGSRWASQIDSALDEAGVFVALVSPEYLRSQSCMFELGAAIGKSWEQRQAVVPVLIRGSRTVAKGGPFAQFHLLDARHRSPEQLMSSLLPLIREAGNGS